MHDLKFAGEIIAAIKKNRKNGPLKVTVGLSPLTHVTPEGLSETFRHAAESEGLGKVDLIVKPLEFTMNCRSCKHASKHSRAVLSCPKCGGSDFDIDIGREFVVESVVGKGASRA